MCRLCGVQQLRSENFACCRIFRLERTDFTRLNFSAEIDKYLDAVAGCASGALYEGAGRAVYKT